MPKTKAFTATEAFEKALKSLQKDHYVPPLYISGATPQFARAIADVKKVCEEHLNGHYELEVIDLYQQPQRAQGDQIVAVPILIRKFPLPLPRIIGDLSDAERVLVGLDLKKRA